MRYIDTANKNEFLIGYSGEMNQNILADDGSNCFFNPVPEHKVLVWVVGELPTLRDMTPEEIAALPQPE